MDEKLIRVFLVDDHVMVREGLASLLSRDPEIRVVGQCGDGLSAVQQVLETAPDVVVLDIAMPGLNGLDLCRTLARKSSKMALLMLTMHDDEQFVAKALEYGAAGYLVKDAVADQLNEAVHAVARGELHLGPGISRKVFTRVGGDEEDPYETLTTRERQVLQLIAEGKTNRQISEALDVAIKTIDTHRAHLMRKLNIHDQTSLVKYALRKGIVPLQ